MLFNSLTADTVQALAGNTGVFIEGYGNILAADVVDCFKACYAAGVKQVTNVAVSIPTSCECPYVWELTTLCQPSQEDGTNYEIANTFPVRRLYQYEDPSGANPTATATADAIAAMINSDANACVTAESNATNILVPAGTIKLTAKYAGKPFQAFTPSGTVTLVTANTTTVMSDTWMAKQFPLQMGSFGSQPTVSIPGVAYCLFSFVIKTDAQDISAANHYNDYYTEVQFFVNSSASNYAADWRNTMNTVFSTCGF
jgi:hypothetical protein